MTNEQIQKGMDEAHDAIAREIFSHLNELTTNVSRILDTSKYEAFEQGVRFTIDHFRKTRNWLQYL